MIKRLFSLSLALLLAFPAAGEMQVESASGEFTLGGDQGATATPTALPSLQPTAAPSPPPEMEVPAVRKISPLSGIAALRVRIELDAGSEKAGIKKDTIQADLKQRFKFLPIPLEFVDDDPGLKPDAYPLLVLSVDMGLDKKWYRPDIYLVNLALKDLVVLQRDPSIRAAGGIWNVAGHGYGNRIVREARGTVMKLADSFIEAWDEANPGRLDREAFENRPAPGVPERDPLEP